jgi:hypothetical protein
MARTKMNVTEAGEAIARAVRPSSTEHRRQQKKSTILKPTQAVLGHLFNFFVAKPWQNAQRPFTRED